MFSYEWNLSDGYPALGITNHRSKVFSTFACGGGSTMGYKLAGYDVIGCNEIDQRMNAVYVANHNPKYNYCEPIQDFKKRADFPSELFDLDVLDGSPPCSSFSLIGNRAEDWGKEKKFKEGQQKQVLDTLFFDFLDLLPIFRPKIFTAENVPGILQGGAKQYVVEIYRQAKQAGYSLQHFQLNGLDMGLPSSRERVFFIGLRNDLVDMVPNTRSLFETIPLLNLKFQKKHVIYKEIEEKGALNGEYIPTASVVKHWNNTPIGSDFSESYRKEKGKRGWFGYNKLDPEKPLNTITAHSDGGQSFHYEICRSLTKTELIKATSFPNDFNFLDQSVKYITGMSVPPLMMANIANEIFVQWLDKISGNISS